NASEVSVGCCRVYWSGAPRDPHSFPTRRSSDLEDVEARLAEAGARGQWTLIDFYADWCVSCHVIERNVFGDATVAQRLSRMQVRSEEHTSELQSREKLVCRLLLEKKKHQMIVLL